MPADKFNLSDAIRQAKAEVMADKRKAVLLSVLVLVGCVVTVRLFVKDTPVKAGAAQKVTAAKSSRSSNKQAVADDLDSLPAAHEVSQSLDYERLPLDRDIFQPNADFFPPETGGTAHRLVEDASDDAEAGDRAQQQIIRAQATSLALQSTMVSENPTAMINGRVLAVGDWISGFEVLEISPHSCTIRKQDVTMVLEMSKTQGN